VEIQPNAVAVRQKWFFHQKPRGVARFASESASVTRCTGDPAGRDRRSLSRNLGGQVFEMASKIEWIGALAASA